ncbi:MAG: DUF3108 domain-containing protein [bacterium]|nr:DUF3108 domain-containing protein [bacterium]
MIFRIAHPLRGYPGLRISLLMLLLFGSTSAYARDYPFQVGEEFTYEVKILGIKAGKQTIKIDSKTNLGEDEVYCITSKTASSSFFSLFYKVYDRIQTYIGVNDLLPRYLKADTHEGINVRHTQTRIDQTNLTAVVLEADRPEKTIKIIPNTIDVVSLIYYLRSKDLELGDTFDLGILSTGSGVKFLNTRVEITEKQTIEVPLGEFPALLAKQSKDGGIGIWFSDDNLRLPLKIEAPTPLGVLSAMLKKAKGIKR